VWSQHGDDQQQPTGQKRDGAGEQLLSFCQKEDAAEKSKRIAP
jgi:hypothetical protein